MALNSPITHSSNSKRKSHRINIPIQAIINNQAYTVLDWSVHGFKVKIDNDEDSSLSLGDTLDIQLILPIEQSSINLSMQVSVRNIDTNTYGMEITDISAKNSRVLRHYATLAIEGRIDSIDDISGTFFMQDVASPIKEPIQLSEKESSKVHKSFKKRLFLYGLLGLIFLSIALSTLVYNYIIVKNKEGFIAGNSSIYGAPFDGTLKKIYVQKGMHIAEGQLLFTMDTREFDEQIILLKEAQNKLQTQLKTFQKQLKQYKKFETKKRKEMKRLTKQNTITLKERLDSQKIDYERAKTLYEKHLLAFKDFVPIQTQYMQTKQHYDAARNHTGSTDKSVLLLEQNYVKNQDHILSVQNSILALTKQLHENALNIEQLQTQSRLATVLATTGGSVYTLSKQAGSQLEFADNVVMLQTDTTPYILMKVLSNEVAKIQLGASCIIYSPRLKKRYKAHISGVGYPAIDGIYVSANELSQNEVPVKISFDDANVQFSLNEYVTVYITNPSLVSQKILSMILGSN
ncbi:PilZ domain-containing protein [Sulfurimonas sp.]|uniref:PilZ domain-containing protein n=1 Tax=Sulfurimonas sp. TaxID=2022749 RepID=UPI0026189862|nr:PilZ domain-containing protein [Sulfurimonas sp.]